MSNQNNCTNNRETIAALVLGILEPDAAKEFQKHIETCKKCQSLYYDMLKEEKDIRSALRTIADKSEVLRENLIENLTNNKPQVEPGVKASKRNVEATLAAHKKVIHSTHTKSNIWEIFINSRETMVARSFDSLGTRYNDEFKQYRDLSFSAAGCICKSVRIDACFRHMV
ncbi:MAG: hypothetical protein P8016_02735 [Sedimentisphaerales bacterium]